MPPAKHVILWCISPALFSNHARSDLHPLRIGSKSRPAVSDTLRFWTGSIWPKAQSNGFRGGLTFTLWSGSSVEERYQVWKLETMVAGRWRAARIRPHDSCTPACLHGQSLMTRPSRSVGFAQYHPGFFCKNGIESDVGSLKVGRMGSFRPTTRRGICKIYW